MDTHIEGITRGDQAHRTQQKIAALAESHRYSSASFMGNLQALEGVMGRVSPEVASAIDRMSKAYRKCADQLDAICADLEPYTYDQTGGDYAEL